MITLAAIPTYTDVADSAFAVDQPLKASTLKQLSINAKFAAVRRETFVGVYTHGQTVAAPKSLIDGYQYSYSEITFWWSRVFSYDAATQKPTGSGCIFSWADAVSAAGVVSVDTNYYIDGKSEAETHDGEIFVVMMCQRSIGATFAAVPTWADVEDADLAGGEPAVASNLGQINANIRYAAVRREFFVQTLIHGDTVTAPTSPVDGYTYQMSELQFLPSMISSVRPGSGGDTLGPGTVRQFGCCVGGMPTVATPATVGQVASFVNYYVNGGAQTNTNDGTILVLVVGTREKGNPPIAPAVRVQPPPANANSFGVQAMPADSTIDGFPVKGVGDAQVLDLGNEVADAKDGTYVRTSANQRDGGGRAYLGLDDSGNVAKALTSAIKGLIALTDLVAASLVADNLAETATRKWAGESGADVTGAHTAADTEAVNSVSAASISPIAGLMPAEAGAEKTTGKSLKILTDLDTANLADGAGLGSKAAWSGVTGSGKPADNADVTAANPQGKSWLTDHATIVSAGDALTRLSGLITSALTDDAGLGITAVWSGVSGTGKPADNADVTAANPQGKSWLTDHATIVSAGDSLTRLVDLIADNIAEGSARKWAGESGANVTLSHATQAQAVGPPTEQDNKSAGYNPYAIPGASLALTASGPSDTFRFDMTVQFTGGLGYQIAARVDVDGGGASAGIGGTGLYGSGNITSASSSSGVSQMVQGVAVITGLAAGSHAFQLYAWSTNEGAFSFWANDSGMVVTHISG